MAKYPEYIMAALRQRFDLEADDTSRDKEINSYSPNEAFEELLNWEGFIGYSSHIKMWINDIYGIDLDEVSMLKVEEENPKKFTCEDCPYHYKDDDDEDYASCHYNYDDGDAPCERE